jgi:hypothetical protein
MTEKVSKESVDYRTASSTNKRCGNCDMYYVKGNFGHCTLVAGNISPQAVCDRWEKKK